MKDLTITSWNVNSLNVRQEQVLAYLEEYQPDVLGLQELKQTTDAVRTQDFIDAFDLIEQGVNGLLAQLQHGARPASA